MGLTFFTTFVHERVSPVRDLYNVLNVCARYARVLDILVWVTVEFVQFRSTGVRILATRDRCTLSFAFTCRVGDSDAGWVLSSRRLRADLQCPTCVFIACACVVCGLSLEEVGTSVGRHVPMCAGR